ncbi:MAG: alkyl hydroperoxide reductase [Gallionellales bacterium RIFOXYB12_FULL_54_9]|nr:MAG: alkyl hydroperoxide reductase [Gallionellales bacterium RIFOXYB12_FULL_54_9]
MVSLQPPLCDFGWKAPNFDLPGVDGVRYNLANARGKNGLLVMFICNHCPYVKSIRDRLVRDTLELKEHGIHSIAIMSNDPSDYEEDSLDNMRLVAGQFGYPFPYVWDESQQVAKRYGAVCTPDFFGFNADMELQYRGRLDASRKEAVQNAPRDLYNAMLQVAQTGRGPEAQIASMGCSIKWK